MKKYFLSHIDFSEMVNVTTDVRQIERAKERMIELRLLTDKGNPSVSYITKTTRSLTHLLIDKLDFRLQNRYGGVTAVASTMRMLYERQEYYACFMYIAFLYGFLEWQVPERISLLPAVPEALKCYCTVLMQMLENFCKESEAMSDNVNTADL